MTRSSEPKEPEAPAPSGDGGLVDPKNVADETDVEHPVEPGGTTEVEKSSDLSARDAARQADADRRAETLAPVEKDAELVHAVNPLTGGPVDEELERAVATLSVPVMKPESRGDMSDITWPLHVQAPPVEQVAPEKLTKANSSTRQREAAAREAATPRP